MLLGALVDVGVPAEKLEETAAGLGIGAVLRVSRVNRSGIQAVKVDVLVDGEPAESAAAQPKMATRTSMVIHIRTSIRMSTTFTFA